MLPKSIRWRLPLSYAAIALLAALSLGAVLLFTLRGYYARQERAYLMGNAQTIGAVAADLLATQVSTDAVQSQVESFAFLSRARVRLLDASEQVLVDSGVPRSTQLALSSANPAEGEVFIVVRQEPFTTPISDTQATEGIFIEQVVIQDRLPSGTPAPLPGDPILVADTLYGFDIGSRVTVEYTSARSNQSVRVPFHDREGNLLGTVELSDGPAYGREIVSSVTRGWSIASVVAVVLSAGVGWLASRRISAPLSALAGVTTRMAEGDLSARADVQRQDEFGMLAHSFNQMAGQVEETVVTLRRFVSDAAHEIHTPLTALRTNLELAPEDDFVHRAQAQAERLETLTESLLDLSRIEADKAAQDHTPITLTPLVREVSEVYASRAEQAGLAFELELPESPDTPVTIQGDETQLRRALSNLLDNAVKFTPEGGTVRVGLRHGDQRVELWVQDTGIGIPDEDLPHLFSRFHRGRNATPFPGSGLGLAIVRAIAEGHGGTVAAENTQNGAQFTLTLPVL